MDQSEELVLGDGDQLCQCPDCGKMMGIRFSAQAYEGDWVHKCWSCGFMWKDDIDGEWA